MPSLVAQTLMVSRAGFPPASFIFSPRKEVTPTIFAMTSSGCLKAAELIRWRIKRRQGSSPGWVWTTKVSFI